MVCTMLLEKTATPMLPYLQSVDMGSLEKGPEHVPTLEKVEEVIGNLMEMGKTQGLVAENGERTETKKIIDEKGLYELGP